MKSTILLFAITVYGVITSNLLMIGLAIPYFILMMMIALVVKYGKDNYPSPVYRTLVKRDIDKTFNTGKMYVFVILCKLSYGFDVAYTIYILFNKYYGILQ